MLIPETGAVTGNLFRAVGHHAALAWSPFGAVETMKPGQLSDAYKVLSGVMPQLTRWQADGRVDAILVAEGEAVKPLSFGGYRVSLAAKARRGQAPASDTRPFAIVVNTAPEEFLFIGGNGVPKFRAFPNRGLGCRESNWSVSIDRSG